MKKIFFLIPLFLFGQNMPPMPPMPPVMDLPTDKHKEKKRPNTKVKNSLPKECQIIPPMLIFMPPPLENDLIKCKNALFMPKKELAEKKLKTKVISIKAVDGFIEVYEIKTKNSIIYCNKDLSKCFEVKRWIKK